MTIEILTSYFKPYVGGIETVVLKLAEGLGKRGYEVVVHTAKSTPGIYKNLPSQEENKYYLIKRYNIYPYSLFFPKLVYNDSILSMHNYSCLMNDYASVRYRSRKKILSPYGNLSYQLGQRQHQYLAPIYDRFIGAQTLKSVNNIIAMTQHEKNEIIKKYPQFKSKISVVPGGIDFYNKNKISSKKLFPFKYFISVGRVVHTKRFEEILIIMKYFTNFHFVLAGRDIGHANFLLNLAKNLGVSDRFHYLGEVSEDKKIALISQAEMFIMPDSASAFGIANLEAFYYLGRVVSASSGGTIDLSNELGGETYLAGDEQGLKKAIERQLVRKFTKKSLSENKQIIEEKYSWDSVVRKYEEVIHK